MKKTSDTLQFEYMLSSCQILSNGTISQCIYTIQTYIDEKKSPLLGENFRQMLT